MVFCEFKSGLVYRVSSRTAKGTQRNPVSKEQKQTKHYHNRHSLHMSLFMGVFAQDNSFKVKIHTNTYIHTKAYIHT